MSIIHRNDANNQFGPYTNERYYRIQIMNNLQYPIGKFEIATGTTHEQRRALIDSIAGAPARLRAAIANLLDEQLDEPYRPGGWTVRQVVHHLPDSHLNAYTRFKLGLTEAEPTIKPYDENRWAQLEDGRHADPEISLVLLEALHRRWVTCLRSVQPEHFARTLNHPEIGMLSLDALLQDYEWHGRHHIAHITSLRERKGW
jgi:DinB superfamily